jgi:hypothetical protein
MNDADDDLVKLTRTTKGKRPSFFADPAMDQMMTFIFELTTELAVLRERQDTMERLLDQHGTISREDIENYRPSDTVEAERVRWRESYLDRVLRMHPAE